MSDEFATGFVAGLVTGVVIAGIIAFFWNMYRGWLRAAGAATRPQAVIHPTNKTPAQIIEAAARARVKMMIFWILLLLIIFISASIMFPDFLQFMLDLVGI
ncbi:MAG: hypothetical protein NT075_09970 [Chloroflexi bacterium]|nr:hypothetical protein [Chloroflexota bacterium]